MEWLSLHDGEELEFVDEGERDVEARQTLSLVGRFLTYRNIRVPIMKDRMANIWRPGRGVQIDEVEPGLFVFQFYHQLDIQKVLKNGPWSFDKHMLVLSMVPEGISPSEVSLKHIPFWVQVHDLPPGFMSENVGKGLGNFIGEFLEYDPKNSGSFWRSFMRIRVLVDVTQPLKRAKKIKKQGGRGEAKVVIFKYEKLEIFCYICGKIGHAEGSCDHLFTMGVDDGVRGWGLELRVENRRGGAGSRSKWLRNGADVDWVSLLQAMNAERNPGSKCGGNFGNSSNATAQNVTERESGVTQHKRPAVVTVSAELLFFPSTNANATSIKVAHVSIEKESNDEAMIMEVDRKRQRSSEIEKNKLYDSLINSNTNKESGGDQMHVTVAVNQEQNGINFLKPGPGKQACWEQ